MGQYSTEPPDSDAREVRLSLCRSFGERGSRKTDPPQARIWLSDGTSFWRRSAAWIPEYAPGAPWQNGYAESFNSRLRDEFLKMNYFHTLKEAQQLATYRGRWPTRTLGSAYPVHPVNPVGGSSVPWRTRKRLEAASTMTPGARAGKKATSGGRWPTGIGPGFDDSPQAKLVPGLHRGPTTKMV